MPETLQLHAPLRDVALPAGFRDRGAASATTEADPAYERGLRDGEKRLGEQLLQQRAEFSELQTGVLKSLRESVPQLVRDCQRELVTLAIDVAGKLVGGIPISTEMVEAVVRDALGQVEEASEVVISLHPDDLALLQKHQSPLLATAGGSPRIQFGSSLDVSRGGCLVQTRFGFIDGRRETKLELLKQAVQS